MNALKKHLPSTVPDFILLPDFASHAELLYSDIACAPRAKGAERPPATRTASFANHYFNQHVVQYPVLEHPNSPNASAQPDIYKTLQPYGSQAFNAQLCPADRHQKTPVTQAEKPPVHTPDFWMLTHQDRMLVKGALRISLTAIESAIIKKMLHHEERVVSKEELIRNIGREPELYRGLEMCLSRLQEKFKRVNDGERLFRSVRNRGYCLTQKIKNTLERSQQLR